MTDVRRSGTEVPAASTVKPMITLGMPRVWPITVAHHTMQKVYTMIQRIDITKETGK